MEQEKEKKISEYDISKDQEIAMTVAFLIDTEIHLWFNAMRSNGERRKIYTKMALEIRKRRARLLESIVRNTEEESWCISKHLLGSTWKSIEIAAKEYSEGNEEKGNQALDNARDFYAIFWILQSIQPKKSNSKLPNKLLH